MGQELLAQTFQREGACQSSFPGLLALLTDPTAPTGTLAEDLEIPSGGRPGTGSKPNRVRC